MRWRERDGSQVARGRAARRAGGVQHPPGRGQRGPVREPQPRAADRRPGRCGAREPSPAGCRARDRSGAGPDRPAGARRRGGPARRADRAERLTRIRPRDCRRPTAMPPRGADLAPLVFVADCLPVALAGPDGVAMIHCGWRGLAAGIVERGVEAVRARRGGGRPRDRPVLLRGGRRGAGCLRAAGPRRRRRAGCSTCARSARRLLERAGVESDRGLASCARAASPELFFSHRRDGGRTGRQAGLVSDQSRGAGLMPRLDSRSGG